MRALEFWHPADATSAEPPPTRTRLRDEIPDRFKWNLTDIFPSWDAWETAYKGIEADISGMPR